MRSFWLAALFFVVTVSAHAQAPESWVDAARALPVEAGRVMPLDTWASVQGTTTKAVLEQWLSDTKAVSAELLLPETLSATARQTAAGLLVYWAEQSRNGQWSEATTAMDALVTTLSDARGPWPLTGIEVLWNHVPWAIVLLALSAVGVGTLWWGPRFALTLPWASVAAWVVLTLTLGLRMWITGRPPVTNLATTFVFVSWLCAGGASLLAFHPSWKGIGALLLAAAGLLPLIAPLVQAPGDPYAPVQAVLATNFWLAVHVPTIAAGYAGLLAAGLGGHAYLVVAGGRRGGTALLPLWKGLRAALLVGLTLTLAGTLLGGFWADQSWGRFWGWDPKENGALLLILWTALTLHLKPSGWAAEWGTALASAFLLPVLLFSWLGVNLLGQGFHSYGAAPDKLTLFLSLLAIDAVFLAIVIVRRALR